MKKLLMSNGFSLKGVRSSMFFLLNMIYLKYYNNRLEELEMTRKNIVNGRFYPAPQDQCLEELKECLEKEPLPDDIPGEIFGAIVPHAGWAYSGSTAALVFKSIRSVYSSPVFILFGAVHVYGVYSPSVWTRGDWETPIGNIPVNEEIADKIIKESNGFITENPVPHTKEHSIEVQLPFIKHLFPDASIVPIMVPPDDNAVITGKIVGNILKSFKEPSVCVGSSDMTHYGFHYDFFDMGKGQKALEWVKDVNDKKLIDLMLLMKEDDVVPEAHKSKSACGSGAITATVAASKIRGAAGGRLLKYTTSYDEIPSGEPASFVGYSGIIFY